MTIDLICDDCGEPNPPGTEFCRNCNAFLAWDGAEAGTPTAPAGTPSGSGAPTVTAPTVQQSTPVVEQAPVDQTYADQASGDQTYADLICPTCGTVNPAARRFCAHCGYSFVAAYGTDPSVDWSAWTPQAMAARDREARRAYRRSLPPLYRWRRVIIVVLLFALFVGLGGLLRRDPVSLARDGWYRLTKEYVVIAGVQAQVEPPTATAPGSDPAALVDGTVGEWTAAWAPTGESACGAAPGTPTIVLTLTAPTRVRQVRIAPGLDKSNPQRDQQPQPKVVGISFDARPCQPVTLAPTDTQEPIELDSRTPVSQVRIGIGSAYPAGPDAKPLISLTEVQLMTFPR